MHFNLIKKDTLHALARDSGQKQILELKKYIFFKLSTSLI